MREVRKLIIGDTKALKAKGSEEEEEEKLQGETVHWLKVDWTALQSDDYSGGNRKLGVNKAGLDCITVRTG